MLGFGVWPHWALHMPLSHLSLFFSMLCSLTLDVSVPLSSSLSSSIYSFLPTSGSSHEGLGLNPMLGFGVWPHWALHMPLSHLSLFSQCYVPSLLTCLSLCLPPSHPPSIPSSLPLCLSSSLSSSLPFSLFPLVPLPFYPLYPPLCVSHPFSLFDFFKISLSLSLYLSIYLSLSLSLSSLSFPLCNVKFCICFSGERYSFPHVKFFLLSKKPS